MYKSDCSTGENMTLGDDGRRYHSYVYAFYHLVCDGNEQPGNTNLTNHSMAFMQISICYTGIFWAFYKLLRLVTKSSPRQKYLFSWLRS